MSEFERSLPMILCSECFSFVLFIHHHPDRPGI